MTLSGPNIGVDELSTVADEKLIRVERVSDDEYVLAHTKDAALVFGGLVSENGMETCQVMLGSKAARFDPETLETEYVQQ